MLSMVEVVTYRKLCKLFKCYLIFKNHIHMLLCYKIELIRNKKNQIIKGNK